MTRARAWERLTLYLPVLLMGLLALGSWWLVRNAPRPPEAAAPRPVLHEPDYYMRDFSVKNFDATGQLQSELRGTLAQHFPDTDTLEVTQARMRSLHPEGRSTTASARRALSNADGSEVQLIGDAVVTRQQPAAPALQFAGEFLHVWVNDERVRSDQPVTLTRGATVLTGDRMAYDNLTQILQMDGRVRGTLPPGGAPARR